MGAGGLPALETLDLSGNWLREEGAVAFFRALMQALAAARQRGGAQRVRLKMLNLASTGMGDAGMLALAEALECDALGSELEQLRICSAQDEGVDALARAVVGCHLARLRELDIRDTLPSREARERLKQVITDACPDIRTNSGLFRCW